MKLACQTALVLVPFALLIACSGSSGSTISPVDTPTPSATGTGNPTGPGADPDDPANQPPHSLGTIVLGESRASGASSPSPIVSATFVPDAKKAAACKVMLDGCELFAAPKCTDDPGFTGCKEGKACSWDDSCTAVCKTFAQCDQVCEADETCVADPGGASLPGKCQKAESFDAGPIAFSGTTTPITLYPPYAFKSDGQGAPFLAGTEIRIQAQGAIGAGFGAFDEKVTATTFLQTSPALKDLPRDQVFGTGPLSIGWAPGNDVVSVTVSSSGGSATCKGTDSTGKISIPRSVVNRVLDSASENASGVLAVSVARQRHDTKKDKKAKGPLTGVTVQPAGWLDLVTTSIESTSFQGCSGGLAACGDACVDTKTDAANCGGCGVPCAGTCSGGKCTTGCVSGPENTLAKCSDGCSNDGDPYIDCDDFDCCAVRTNCPATTACGKPQ